MGTSTIKDDSHFYQGDLAYLGEVEKRGRIDLLFEAKMLTSLQDFGVESIHLALSSAFYELWLSDVGRSWAGMCKFLYGRLARRADEIIERDDIIDPVRNKFTWQYGLYYIFGQWQVPARDDPKKMVGVTSGDVFRGAGLVTIQNRIMQHLIKHEIQEQLTFGGYRLFDPHSHEYARLPQFSPSKGNKKLIQL